MIFKRAAQWAEELWLPRGKRNKRCVECEKNQNHIKRVPWRRAAAMSPQKPDGGGVVNSFGQVREDAGRKAQKSVFSNG